MTVEADRAQTTTELCYTCQFLNASMFTASSLQDVSSTKGVIASRRASQRREHHTAGCPAYVGRRSVQTYGIELWGCTKPSNVKILQTFQSKMLRMICSVPWYVSNQILHNDFDIPYVKDVVRINANKYKNRYTVHSNQLIITLFNPSVDRRLKRLWPEDLAQ